MQAYVRKQAQNLLDIEGNSNSNNPALADLQRLSVEMTALLVCFGMSIRKANGVLFSLNMEDGSVFQDPLPDSARDNLLVSIKSMSCCNFDCWMHQQVTSVGFLHVFCSQNRPHGHTYAEVMYTLHGKYTSN